MQTWTTRRALIAASGAGLMSVGLSPRGHAAPRKKLKIALSNSFIGNKWRIEMENLFKAALQMEPYKSEVEGTWFNSGNSVSHESQQISELISERVDAILIDAASPTGLNGIVNQAVERGILVISFDNVVTTPKAIKVTTDERAGGAQLAEFLVKKLNGKGNVIMVTGVAGTTYDENLNGGADSIWKQHPGIKVVNRYTGMWDPSTAQRNTAAILPGLPKIDGIWCQGGVDGVLKAFIAAGRTPLPVTAGMDDNGFRKFMIGYMGQKVDGISIGQPPYLSILSLELARRILQKSYPRRNIIIPMAGVTSETVKVGETVFPDLPDSLSCGFTDSGPDAMVKICVDAVLKGAPCAGTLKVRLPKV